MKKYKINKLYFYYDEAFRSSFSKGYGDAYQQARQGAQEDYSKYADVAQKALARAGSVAEAARRTGVGGTGNKKNMKSFKEWIALKEVGTTTASVATFKMPLFGDPVIRMYPEPITIGQDSFFRKKKKKT